MNKESIGKARRPSMAILLDGAIGKWRLMLAMRDGEEPDCPLCEWMVGCRNCPVAKASGDSHCEGTPYGRWADHRDEVHGDAEGRDEWCPACARIVKAEIKFLEGLRDVR